MSLKLRTVVTTVLLANATTAVLAQQTGAVRPAGPAVSASGVANGNAQLAPAASASAAAASGVRGYKSAFSGYRAYAEQPVQSWRESNDVVGRIGGWQAYAREGQGGPVAGSGDKQEPAAMQGKPEMPTMPGMPAGHGGMNMQAPAGSTPAAPMAPATSGAMPSKAPMKMPARGLKPLATSAQPPSAAASAALATPGAHTGHQKP